MVLRARVVLNSMIKKNLKGIGLLEAFLAAFIFVIAVSAIFAGLSSLRKPAVKNEQELTAALAGRAVLEELRSNVATGDDEGYLKAGMHPPGAYPVSMNTSIIQYNVECVDSSDATVACGPQSLRKVTLNSTWSDIN